MVRFFGRCAAVLLVAGLIAVGLGVVSAHPAMAQGPCGPGQQFTQPFDTASAPQTFASFSQTGVPANCASSTLWSVAYDAFQYSLVGPAPHTVTAETCNGGSTGDTYLYLYQSPTGSAGAFNPGNTCTNLLTENDQGCGNQSRVTNANLSAGFYTVVVSPWWPIGGNVNGNIFVEAPTCGFFSEDAILNTFVNSNPRGCNQAGDELVGTLSFTNVAGQTAFDVEVTGIYPPELIGIGGCSANSGTCAGSATGFTWNGDVAGGQTITINYRVQIKGGTRAGVTMCVNFELSYSTGEGAPPIVIPFQGCAVTDCAPTVDPNAALSGQVHLPILNFQGQNDACRTWLEVQNVGDEFSKAALVVWGEPGFCPPQCAGPLKVECSGLLKPGSTWNFMSPTQVPNGSKSGILFSFTARQLSDINVDLGFDDIVADVLCETLFFGVVGDCDDYRRFKKAYNEGLEFAGIPLDRAVGSPLAVEVLRHCPGDQTPGAEVSSKYGGIAGIDLGAYDPVFGGYAYYVPLLYAQSADFNSVMYIQNGGLECSSVEIWFKAQDDCLRARICEIFTLAPGETWQFDANDCVGPDFQGNAWLRSSQPLGIAVDIFGRDVLMTYVGIPTELNYTFDPSQATFTTGNQVAYGPLIYSEYQGWDTGVQVQNMSSVVAAKVKVYFLDRSGDIITTLVDWICPRGSQTYFLPVVADLPGGWVGSVRVESQEWFSPGDPLVLPPNITGIVTLIKYTDAARSDTAEAIAYNLLTEQRAYDWQLGCCGGGTDSGIGLIAIPSVLKDLDNTGVTAELAIANLVPKPGFTDFAIYIYDQNGLIDYVCQKLNEKQVEYISFESWGYLNPGFKGSAIISAVFWEHDMFDDDGLFIRNLLGLAAVVVERTGTRMGEDIPGDEAAGTTGIPFREFETEDDEFFFDFEGPVTPLCPGVGFRAPPGSCTAAGIGDGNVLTIEQGPPFANAPRGDPCQSGGVNARNFGTYDFFICAAGEYTIELVSVNLTPFNGASCGLAGEDVFVQFYFGPEGYDPNAECDNYIASNNDGGFDAMGAGDSFTVTLPDPETAYTIMIQNNCDTTPPQSVGDIEFNLNPG